MVIVVWFYYISWNETKYNADNNTGWQATKSNDTSDPRTVYNWNGFLFASLSPNQKMFEKLKQIDQILPQAPFSYQKEPCRAFLFH